MIYSKLIRPLLFRFDPEQVHEMVLHSSSRMCRFPKIAELLQSMLRVPDPVQLAGIRFPNRIGLAAGFDKNGYFVEAARALGFGHLEVGAVTPLPQPGHPRPRLFRVPGEPSLRNRMGFNNEGAARILPRLPLAGQGGLVVGVNVGKGADTPLAEAGEDYLKVIRQGYPRADYFSINISSPNTADLRELGRGQQLRRFCGQLVQGNGQAAQEQDLPRRPLFLKVSPDSSDDELLELAEVARSCEIDGLIATNTTASRQGSYAAVDAAGGLSGQAVRARSLHAVGLLRRAVGKGYPLIGVGGVLTPSDAHAMRMAGADLVQIYTGFIYGGPLLPSRLAATMQRMSLQ